ncbi:MAG: ABC transporter ATP-binding protein [Vulcanimicrobiota bacterium]
MQENIEAEKNVLKTRAKAKDIGKLTGGEIKEILGRLYQYLKPFLATFLLGAFFAGLHGLVAGAQPYFIKILMDDVLIKKDLEELKLFMILIFASAVLKGFFMYGQGYFLSFAGQKAVKSLRDDVYRHIQNLSVPFFEKWQAGQIMYRVITDINLMTEIFTNGLTNFFADVAIFIFALGMMFYLNWKLILVAFISSPIIALVMRHFGNLIQKHVSRMQNRISDLNSIMQENINGIKVIKSFNSEEYENNRFSRINNEAFHSVMKSIQFKLTQAPIVEFIGTIGVLIIIGFGSYQVATGRLTTGELVAFIAYMLIATTPINRSSNTYADFRKAMVSAARVFELLDIEEKLEDAPDAVELEEIKGLIEFRDVKFSYDENNPVINGISFHARPGEMIAIVGPNGAGKTTLVNLIPRFYDLTSGSITVDGTGLKEIKIASLRSHIGMVLQETILFSGTIRENIAYARPEVPLEQVEKAARIANAHDFVTELPDGYDTLVGERGVGLSGGQKQRISIARTILRNPRILIMDEATSALDQKSEAQLQEALEHLMEGRTTFVIAHRLATIQKADRILVLDRGRIAEIGAHDELIRRDGVYKKLYEAQKTLEEEGGTITGEVEEEHKEI